MTSLLIDWTKPIEAVERDWPSRPVRLTGETRTGDIDYMQVHITGARLYAVIDNQDGVYAAAKNTGWIRGTLKIRNVVNYSKCRG